MATIKIPQDTSFTFDIPGRYICNTLDEALDSTNTGLSDQADARPFDFIVIGGGSFGAALTARLFNIDLTHSHRILVLEAGPLALQEHVQNLPPDLGPPGKGTRARSGASRGYRTARRASTGGSRAWRSASAGAPSSGAAGRPTSSTPRWLALPGRPTSAAI